jgi:hypothetical protein
MKGLLLTGAETRSRQTSPTSLRISTVLAAVNDARAADGGGLRPSLTAAVRGATWLSGRDEETAPAKQRN